MLSLVVLGVVLIIATTLVGGHFFLTWAERRGWVYYRSKHRPPPRSLGLFEEIYQPSITHVVDQEVTAQTEAGRTKSGEDL